MSIVKKSEPIGTALSSDDVKNFNNRIYDHYRAPYWVYGLTCEVWLTIAFTENTRPLFKKLQEIILKECHLRGLRKNFSQFVRLEEKVLLIDKFQKRVDKDNRENLSILLNHIKDDYPDTGFHYYFEAEYFAKQLVENK